MNSKEALEKLLKENEKARDSFQRIGGLPEEEARKELENRQAGQHKTRDNGRNRKVQLKKVKEKIV